MASVDSTASKAVANESSVRGFVVLLTLRLLHKCQAFERSEQEECAGHTQHLADQTMEAFRDLDLDLDPDRDLDRDLPFDRKSVKRVCRAVLQDLRPKFGGLRQLKRALLLRDPLVDRIVVHALQAHVRLFWASSARRRQLRTAASSVLRMASEMMMQTSPLLLWVLLIVFIMPIL